MDHPAIRDASEPWVNPVLPDVGYGMDRSISDNTPTGKKKNVSSPKHGETWVFHQKNNRYWSRTQFFRVYVSFRERGESIVRSTALSMYQCIFDSWPIVRTVAISMFNEHGYPHMKTTGEWSALITTSFWKVSFLVVDGYAWSIFRTCFWLVVPFLGEQEFLRTGFFFRSSGVPSSVLHGLQAMCFETIENIMKHIDLSPKQRIFKCAVPKVTLNPGNVPQLAVAAGWAAPILHHFQASSSLIST